MGLFSKPEIREVTLPIKYISNMEEYESGVISFQAEGEVDDEYVYFCTMYNLKDHMLYNNGGYEEIIANLTTKGEQNITLKLKYKGSKYKDFTVDVEEFAKVFDDEKLLMLDHLGRAVGADSFEK